MEKYIRVIEAAEIAGVTPQTIRNLCRAKSIRFRKHGNSFLPRKEDIVTYAEKMKSCEKIQNDIDSYMSELENKRTKLKMEIEKASLDIIAAGIMPERINILSLFCVRLADEFRDKIHPLKMRSIAKIYGGNCRTIPGFVARNGSERHQDYESISNLAAAIRNEYDKAIAKVSEKDQVIENLKKQLDSAYKEQEDPLLSRPVIDEYLSVRAINILHGLGVKTLGDLTKMTRKEILRSRNCGHKSMKLIDDVMKSNNLKYKE